MMTTRRYDDSMSEEEDRCSKSRSWSRGRRESVLAGTADEIVERLGRLSEAGVQWVMLQWLEVDDIYALEAMACSVLPQLRL
jgi:alkanesulfonate monooxygenase SsuD/methylene tetrahydromethanopterin reductase-like flavin-dependent oxidoreductase (luciferase family)